jgi:3D (Asp-Asp-Asp) domain-containing protein
LTFTASASAPSGTTYSALVCTNTGMTNCITVTPSTVVPTGTTVSVPSADASTRVYIEVVATGPFTYYVSATSARYTLSST